MYELESAGRKMKKGYFIVVFVFAVYAAFMCLFVPRTYAVDVCLGTFPNCSSGETLSPASFGQTFTKTYDVLLKNHTTANDIAGFRLEYNFDSSVVTCSSVTLNTSEGLADFGGDIECKTDSGHLVIAGFIDIFSSVDYKSTPLKIATVTLLVNAKYDVDLSSSFSQNKDLTYVSTKASGTLLPAHLPFLIHIASETTPPSCSVTPLSATYGASTFPVAYTCSDNFAVAHADLYVLEKNSSGGVVKDWSTYSSLDGLPGSLTFPQTLNFTGAAGDTFCFKAVAYDSSGNASPAPSGNGDTCARVAKFAVLAAQKPGNSQQLGIVVLSVDTPAVTPAVSVTAGSCSAVSVNMGQTVTKTFIGTYTLQSGCTGTTKVCVNANEECISFTMAKLSQSLPSSLSYGKASAGFEKESVQEDVFVTLFEETQSTYPQELHTVTSMYRVGPEDQKLLKEASITFALPLPLTGEEKSKMGIYEKIGNTWTMLPTEISSSNAAAKTKQLGIFGIFSDFTPPSISNVALNENLLEAKISDAGSGVKTDSISVQVNGNNIPFTYDEKTKMLKAALDNTVLSSGSATVSIQAKDNVQNVVNYKESKTVLFAPFDLQRVFAAPNPVRAQGGGITLMMDVDEAHGKLLAAGMLATKIELFTLTGKLMATISGGELPSATKQKIGNALRLRQKMQEGADFPVLPNGVYIFRVSVTDTQGKTISKVGKLVIAR